MSEHGNLALPLTKTTIRNGVYRLMVSYKQFAEQFKDFRDLVSTKDAQSILGVNSTQAVRQLMERNPEDLKGINIGTEDNPRWVLNKEDVIKFQFHRNPDYTWKS